MLPSTAEGRFDLSPHAEPHIRLVLVHVQLCCSLLSGSECYLVQWQQFLHHGLGKRLANQSRCTIAKCLGSMHMLLTQAEMIYHLAYIIVLSCSRTFQNTFDCDLLGCWVHTTTITQRGGAAEAQHGPASATMGVKAK